jgi:UDP-N-acetylglucosamine 2-epimerase (non-hydrolysing)
MRFKVCHIVGARPNFIKAAPLIKSISKIASIDQKIIHTGQHYSKNLSDSFFEILKIPLPDYHLGVGSASHAAQTSKIMECCEAVFLKELVDLVIVYGDVNSTLAATLVASKMNIPIAHVESGLRSFDREMPEEINRVIVDHISDILLVSEESGIDNLKREGIEKGVSLVGNIMIDTLSDNCNFSTKEKEHVLMTCHRPSNVDSAEGLKKILKICQMLDRKIVFPVHPRTKFKILSLGLSSDFDSIENLSMIDSQNYTSFLKLMKESSVIITDSGGIQEESTFLGIPCLTLRKNTERPSTVNIGTNTLVDNVDEIITLVNNIDQGTYKKGTVPALWDGNTANRITNIIKDFLEN